MSALDIKWTWLRPDSPQLRASFLPSVLPSLSELASQVSLVASHKLIFTMKSFTFFVPLLAAISVSAHGFVDQITIDGKVFKGNIPSKATNPSVIRQISDPSPIKGAANPSVNCGTDAKPASLVADANPGSKLTFSWKGEDLSNVCLLPTLLHSDSYSALLSGPTTPVPCSLTWLHVAIPRVTSSTPLKPNGSRSIKSAACPAAIGLRPNSVSHLLHLPHLSF